MDLLSVPCCISSKNSVPLIIRHPLLIQWNLRITDTLGAELLSFVDRLFLSQRCYLATPLNYEAAKLQWGVWSIRRWISDLCRHTKWMKIVTNLQWRCFKGLPQLNMCLIIFLNVFLKGGNMLYIECSCSPVCGGTWYASGVHGTATECLIENVLCSNNNKRRPNLGALWDLCNFIGSSNRRCGFQLFTGGAYFN